MFFMSSIVHNEGGGGGGGGYDGLIFFLTTWNSRRDPSSRSACSPKCGGKNFHFFLLMFDAKERHF